MSLSAETHVVVDALEAASRGTSALAGDIRAGRRSVDGERMYANYLRELASVLEVHALMYDEQQNPTAPVLELTARRGAEHPAMPADLALFGDLLGELGMLVRRFSERFVALHGQLPEPEPPHTPPPTTA